MNEPEVLAGCPDTLVQTTLILRGDPDLIAQVTGVSNAVDHRRAIRDIHGSMIHEPESGVGYVFVGQSGQQLAGAWSGDRETHEPHVITVQTHRPIRRLVLVKPTHVVNLSLRRTPHQEPLGCSTC